MKINNIEINKGDVHDAIIARILDYCMDNYCTYGIEQGENNERWFGPKLLPREIKDIEVIKDAGIFFTVIRADGVVLNNCNLGSNLYKDLENQGFI